MAWSQRTGCRRKDIGDMSVQGNPAYSGSSTPKIRPMSWYRGNQLTMRLDAPNSQTRCIILRLWKRFPYVTITPLGVPVDPEVYWRKASVSPVTAGPCQPASAPSGIASVASQRKDLNSAVSLNERSTAERTAVVVMATV